MPKLMTFINGYDADGSQLVIEHPVSGPLYHRAPYGVRYIDAQGNIVIQMFPLISDGDVQQVRGHVQERIKHFGWKRVLIFDLNKTTLTPAGDPNAMS